MQQSAPAICHNWNAMDFEDRLKYFTSSGKRKVPIHSGFSLQFQQDN